MRRRAFSVSLLLVRDIDDSLVHQIFGQVVAGSGRLVDAVIVLNQERSPLIGLNVDEVVLLFNKSYFLVFNETLLCFSP